jgi:O-antigen/teichoic acid export membrane protein
LTNADVAEASRWVAPLVAVGTVFCGGLWIFETVVVGLNRPKLILIADIEGAIANLSINLAFLPLMKSITVPAVAASVGFAVAAIGLAFHLRSSWRLKVEWSALFRFCAAALVMAGVLYLLGFRPGEVRPVGIFYLAASVATGVIAYFAVLRGLGGFGRREWEAIRNLLASRAPEAGGQAAALAAVEPPAAS